MLPFPLDEGVQQMWRENADDADFAGNFWPMAALDQVVLFRPTATLQRGVSVESHVYVGVFSALKHIYLIKFFIY